MQKPTYESAERQRTERTLVSTGNTAVFGLMDEFSTWIAAKPVFPFSGNRATVLNHRRDFDDTARRGVGGGGKQPVCTRCIQSPTGKNGDNYYFEISFGGRFRGHLISYFFRSPGFNPRICWTSVVTRNPAAAGTRMRGAGRTINERAAVVNRLSRVIRERKTSGGRGEGGRRKARNYVARVGKTSTPPSVRVLDARNTTRTCIIDAGPGAETGRFRWSRADVGAGDKTSSGRPATTTIVRPDYSGTTRESRTRSPAGRRTDGQKALWTATPVYTGTVYG